MGVVASVRVLLVEVALRVADGVDAEVRVFEGGVGETEAEAEARLDILGLEVSIVCRRRVQRCSTDKSKGLQNEPISSSSV